MKQISKITFLTISLRKGGAENQLVKLAVSLKRKGYDISIVSFMEGNDFGELLNEERIDNVVVPVKKASGLIKLFNLIGKRKPDVLITFMFAANLIGRAVKIRYNIPLITSVRNNEISKVYKALYRITYKIDDLTTFNSEYAYRKFVKEKLCDARKSAVVPNAVSFSEGSNSPIVEESSFDLTLVSIAHFRPQKDYRTLFEAVKNVRDRGINIRLLVLGHLFNQKWPEETLIELDIKNIVTLVGFTNQTQPYLNKSDVLVLSSLWEGTPNAILEGMANHLPIIASNIPGNKELIERTDGGFLFEKQNDTDLAEKIIALHNMAPLKRAEMGMRGYNYVMEHYEETKVHRKWEELIANVAK